MATLRTTINPTEELEVDDREALDLERMGLVLTGTRAKTDEGLTEAAVRQFAGETGDTATAPTPAPRKRAPRKRAPRPRRQTSETGQPDTSASKTSDTTPTDIGENAGVTDNGGDAEKKEG